MIKRAGFIFLDGLRFLGCLFTEPLVGSLDLGL